MSAIYPLSVHRRIERRWAERIKSLTQSRRQLVVATERTLQRVFDNVGPLIPVPVRTERSWTGDRLIRFNRD